MNPLKLKIAEEIMELMDSYQGKDFKSALDGEKNESPFDEAMESPEKQKMEDEMGLEMHGKPKGIAVEKVSVMAKPGMEELMEKKDAGGVGVEKPESGEEEMSDDELEMLLKKLGSKMS